MEAFIVPTQKFREVYALVDCVSGQQQARFAFIRTLELQAEIRRACASGRTDVRVRCFYNPGLGKWEVSEVIPW